MDSVPARPWLKILLIEDDEDDYILTRTRLSKAQQTHYQLEWARTCEAGKQALQNGQYDAVLLDYFLGAKNGLEFLRDVDAKSLPYPLILISGKGSAEMDLDVFEAGATFSITKGEATTSLLERSIHYAIEHRQLEEKLKQSEETVRQKERRMAEILSSIQDGFFELDRTWRFTYLNERAAGNGNFRPEELVGKSVWEVFPYFLNSPYEEVYCRVMETRQPEHLEIKSLVKDCWYSLNIYPSEAGISVYWLDITERKQAELKLQQSITALRENEVELRQSEAALRESEAALRESEAKFRGAFENAAIGFAMTSADGHFIDANPTYTRITGYTIDELRQLPFTNIIHPGDYAENMRLHQQMLDREIPGYVVENRYRRKDGQAIWVRKSISVVCDAGGAVLWSIALVEDITERKHAEQALQQHDAELEAIFNAQKDAIIVNDNRGIPIRGNPAAQPILGFDPVGKTPGEIVQRLQLPNGTKSSVTLRALQGETVENVEQVIQGRVYLATAAPMEDKENQVIGAVTVLKDITQLKENEVDLRDSHHALQISEDKFAKAFQSNPAMLSISRTSDGMYIDVNESFTRILGYSREEVIGHTSADLGFVADPEKREALVLRLREEGRISNLEARFPVKSGEMRNILFSMEPIVIEDEDCLLITFIDITERTRAEAERERLLAEIQRQKELLERLVQNAPVGIAVLYGPEHRFKLVNSIQHSLFPAIPEFVGRTVAEIWPDNTDTFQPVLDRVYQTGESYSAADAPWLTDKGHGLEEAFYTFSYTPLFDNNGSIEGILVLSVETTEQVKARQRIEAELAERKRAEAALEQAHASLTEERNRLLAVMESIPIGLATYDMNGGVIQANTAFDAVWGSPRPPANSVADYDLYKAWWVNSGERVQAEAWAAARAVREGETVTGQFIKIRRFDGSDGYILNSGAPVRNAKGQVAGAVVAIMDITDRVRAEKALEESERSLRISEEHFRVALKNSPMLVYTCDRDLRYTWIYNPAFGFEPSGVVGKTDEELNNPEDVSELVALKRSVIESGTGKRQEIQLRYQGEVRYYDVTVEPVRGEQDEVTGLTVAAIDITEIKQMEQARVNDQIQIELQRQLMGQREQERQSIARDIHDGPIQTLVSTVFNIQMTKEALSSPAMQVELNQIGISIKNAIQELRDVVNELRPPSLQRFGLSRTVRMHAQDFNEKHAEIQIEDVLEDDQGKLPEDVCLTLFRIYQEALNNVVRHSQATKVRVHFYFEEGKAVLEVRDNGKGIADTIDLISQTTKGHYGVAGMKERAEAIKGDFQLVSSPGKGTTIRISVAL